jgi:hypothetical protein
VAENNYGYNENSRGLGLLDLMKAVEEDREPRASGELSSHVLEIMLGILDSPNKGAFVDIKSRCNKPKPLPEIFP